MLKDKVEFYIGVLDLNKYIYNHLIVLCIMYVAMSELKFWSDADLVGVFHTILFPQNV